MKPRAVEAADRGTRLPDGMQGKPEKVKPSLKNVKKDTGRPERLKYKPLTGKVFYLDIPSNVIAEKIGKELRELGGRVESFLSKDISYLVSTKKEAKFAPALGQISPVPSPESAQAGGNSSPHPSNQRDRHEVPMSRGKSLVEKAIKEQDLIPSGSILSSALSWGVKILHLDDVKNYIEQKKKELYLMKRADSSCKDGGKQVPAQKSRSGKLKNPFVKVEDSSRRYRPFYLQFPSFPVLNYCVPNPYSPFEVEKKHPSGPKQTHLKQRNKINSDKDCGTPVPLLQKDKKKRGYCECCGKKYEDLQTHLESDQHQKFAQSTQYQVVDDIISKLVYEFVAYKDDAKTMQRPKCSTGCFCPVVGKVTRAEELQERLKRQRLSLRSYSWKDPAVRALQPDRQPAEIQPNALPPPAPPPASARSQPPWHLPQPAEGRSKGRRNDENLEGDCSCTVLLREAVVSLRYMHPPPPKGDRAPTEIFPQAHGPVRKETLEPEGNKPHVHCVQQGLWTSHTPSQVKDVSEKDRSLGQPKRKLNNTAVLPAKCLKKTDWDPALVKEQLGPRENRQEMQQHSVLLEPKVSDSAVSRKLGELAASSAQGSPSGKLCRKVKLYLGRNKREARKQSVELDVKTRDGLSVPEEKSCCCSSPVQALLELFQSSERSSEFGGFSASPENKGSSSMKEDTWEGQNANVAWSIFSSSSSSSPFVGF
ncbi:DBF4A protein, partial [Galbula dea]|nr:DBF4A protein [Galbula dea]